MAYTKTNWQDTPSLATPINATNLNKLETGVFDNDAAITALNAEMEAGWLALSGTFTYASDDAPTFVINTPSNLTGVISVGMKLKLTQTTVKYFIVTAITSTTITVYGGTDYTLVNAAITLPFYSVHKSPFGFPIAPLKWTQTASISFGTYTALTARTNTTVLTLSLPIGVWNLEVVGYMNFRTAQNAVIFDGSVGLLDDRSINNISYIDTTTASANGDFRSNVGSTYQGYGVTSKTDLPVVIYQFLPNNNGTYSGNIRLSATISYL
jgi:hypothetical protein